MSTKGFGVGLQAPGLPGGPGTSRDITTLLQEIAKYLWWLRDRHAMPPVLQPYAINLTTGQQQVLETRDREWSLLTVSVLSGTCDIWIGEGGSGNTPHLRFTSVGVPVMLPFPLGSHKLTVQATGGTMSAGIILSSA